MSEYVPLSEVAKAFGPRYRKPRKPRKRKTYVEVFFEASIAGSMLRTLHACGSMTQADFMTLYHKRCARDNPSRSSFGANFGRYVKREQMYADRWREWDVPLGCLQQGREGVHHANRNVITWIGLAMPEMVAILDPKTLDRAENTMERLTFTYDDSDPRQSETLASLVVLRAEMRARSTRMPASIKPDFKLVASWLRACGTTFANWYDNGAELDDSIPSMIGVHREAWDRIRTIAESWDMTVLELLDADRILWGQA